MTDWTVLPGPRHELAEEPTAVGDGLLWVDVPRGEIWSRPSPLAEPALVATLDAPISAARPTASGTVVASRTSVLLLAGAERRVLARLPHDPAAWQVNGLVVLDDGGVVAGLLSRDRSQIGELVLLRDGDVVGRVTGVRAANGLCLDPSDPASVWHVDTYARTLTRYRIDGDELTGEPLDAFVGLPGRPDGIAPATGGGVWVAMWDGGCVVHLDAGGRLVRTLPTPVSRPTCPLEVGGSLVVTTARTDGDSEPLGGRLLLTALG